MTVGMNIDEIEKKMKYLVATSGGMDDLSTASFDDDHKNTKEMLRKSKYIGFLGNLIKCHCDFAGEI